MITDKLDEDVEWEFNDVGSALDKTPRENTDGYSRVDVGAGDRSEGVGKACEESRRSEDGVWSVCHGDDEGEPEGSHEFANELLSKTAIHIEKGVIKL